MSKKQIFVMYSELCTNNVQMQGNPQGHGAVYKT